MRWLGVLGIVVLLLVGTLPAAAATTATSSLASGNPIIQKDCISTYLGVEVRKRVSGGEVVLSELYADLLRLNTCRSRELFDFEVQRPLQSGDHFRVSPDRSRGRLIADVQWTDEQTGEVVPGSLNLTWTANDSKVACGEPSDTQREADVTGTATVGDRIFRFTLPDPSCSYLDRFTFKVEE